MRKTSILVVLSVAILLMTAMPASTAPLPTLSGTYSIVGTSVCVRTAYGPAGTYPPPQGFSNDNTFTLLTAASTRTRNHMGTLTLNRDGFGTVHERFLQINHQAVDAGQKPINEWEGDCQVSYQAQADGTFLMLFYNCIGQNVSGDGYPGMSGSDSNYWTAVQVNSDTLLFSMTDPYITDQWNFFTGQQPAYAERICSGSRTAIRIR